MADFTQIDIGTDDAQAWADKTNAIATNTVYALSGAVCSVTYPSGKKTEHDTLRSASAVFADGCVLDILRPFEETNNVRFEGDSVVINGHGIPFKITMAALGDAVGANGASGFELHGTGFTVNDLQFLHTTTIAYPADSHSYAMVYSSANNVDFNNCHILEKTLHDQGTTGQPKTLVASYADDSSYNGGSLGQYSANAAATLPALLCACHDAVEVGTTFNGTKFYQNYYLSSSMVAVEGASFVDSNFSECYFTRNTFACGGTVQFTTDVMKTLTLNGLNSTIFPGEEDLFSELDTTADTRLVVDGEIVSDSYFQSNLDVPYSAGDPDLGTTTHQLGAVELAAINYRLFSYQLEYMSVLQGDGTPATEYIKTMVSHYGTTGGRGTRSILVAPNTSGLSRFNTRGHFLQNDALNDYGQFSVDRFSGGELVGYGSLIGPATGAPDFLVTLSGSETVQAEDVLKIGVWEYTCDLGESGTSIQVRDVWAEASTTKPANGSAVELFRGGVSQGVLTATYQGDNMTMANDQTAVFRASDGWHFASSTSRMMGTIEFWLFND